MVNSFQIVQRPNNYASGVEHPTSHPPAKECKLCKLLIVALILCFTDLQGVDLQGMVCKLCKLLIITLILSLL